MNIFNILINTNIILKKKKLNSLNFFKILILFQKLFSNILNLFY